jgi:predicted nucleic acid-binding protein
LSARNLERTKHELDRRWSRLWIVELDRPLAKHAGDTCEAHALRAGDGVQLAAALQVGDPELVFVTWDTRLREAARAAGLPVAA